MPPPWPITPQLVLPSSTIADATTSALMRWSGFRFSRHPFSVSFKANGGPKPPGRYAGRETGRSHRLHAHLVVDWYYDAAVKGADAVTARPGFVAMLDGAGGGGRTDKTARSGH